MMRRAVRVPGFLAAAAALHAPSAAAFSHSSSSAAFHPLGPPTCLAALALGQSLLRDGRNVTRLSASPDVFLVRNFLTEGERSKLMWAAARGDMKAAGTKRSGANTVRRGSRLMWIDPNGGDGHGLETAAAAGEAVRKARTCFSHDAMNDLLGQSGRPDYASAEDVQVAMYEAGGSYDYHHDGFGRYSTVLTYLNGIGGTYFPFANGNDDVNDTDIDFAGEGEVAAAAARSLAGREGLLLVGREGIEAYLPDGTTMVETNPSSSVVEVRAGDAVAFYSYDVDGREDPRSLHCSLAVPEEKWITTCWFRSEALTGPFGPMKRDRWREERMEREESMSRPESPRTETAPL